MLERAGRDPALRLGAQRRGQTVFAEIAGGDAAQIVLEDLVEGCDLLCQQGRNAVGGGGGGDGGNIRIHKAIIGLKSYKVKGAYQACVSRVCICGRVFDNYVKHMAMLEVLQKLQDAYYRRKFARSAPLSAARIKAVSENLVSDITARKVGALDRAPVFAVIGETHDQPMHRLILLKTALGLKQKGFNVNVGFETPYNFQEYTLSMLEKDPAMSAQLNEETKGVLALVKDREFDDLGRAYFLNCVTRSLNAPHTAEYLGREFFAHKIRYAMNDAARLYEGHDSAARFKIDLKDPCVRTLLTEAERADDKAVILMAGARGIFLRNQVMVEKACAHAALRGADIYLQYCGSAHVAGNASRKRKDHQPYKESLLALFNQAGCNAVGFVLGCDFSYDYLRIPPEADPSAVSKIRADDVRAGSGLFAAKEKVWLETVKPYL